MVYYIIMKCVEYKKILIVEDCDDQRVALEKYFSAKNTVTACATVAAATAALYDSRFDIILLDLILPDGSGLSILDRAEKTPVVIFSDLGSDSNLLEGFTLSSPRRSS